MSLPYFPMYPTDFEADTSHLTLEEDGAYNRLLRLMWMTPGCSLPNDNAWIMRRMRCDAATFERVVRVVLDEFFTVKAGRIINPRLTLEHEKTSVAHQRRVSAGSKGGKAKALKTNKTAPSNAVAMPKQPEPEPEPLKRDTNVSPKKRGSRLPDNWCLPKQDGEWALGEGWPETIIRSESEKFKDYWHSVAGQKGVKLDWSATWRNWMRNSKSPKVLAGGSNDQFTSKSQERLTAFISGARGAS